MYDDVDIVTAKVLQQIPSPGRDIPTLLPLTTILQLLGLNCLLETSESFFNIIGCIIKFVSRLDVEAWDIATVFWRLQLECMNPPYIII